VTSEAEEAILTEAIDSETATGTMADLPLEEAPSLDQEVERGASETTEDMREDRFLGRKGADLDLPEATETRQGPTSEKTGTIEDNLIDLPTPEETSTMGKADHHPTIFLTAEIEIRETDSEVGTGMRSDTGKDLQEMMIGISEGMKKEDLLENSNPDLEILDLPDIMDLLMT
jgi:hypothetical protein